MSDVFFRLFVAATPVGAILALFFYFVQRRIVGSGMQLVLEIAAQGCFLIPVSISPILFTFSVPPEDLRHGDGLAIAAMVIWLFMASAIALLVNIVTGVRVVKQKRKTPVAWLDTAPS
ncbi:MAG: hypothetical protein ACJAVR_004020 [Paracoccaceae bacterium]|jgi:hypothetical protein